jgi:hypothetical protein
MMRFKTKGLQILSSLALFTAITHIKWPCMCFMHEPMLTHELKGKIQSKK